jgi:hypothetical protein
MSDARTIIERAAERVTPRTDAFERLERRRQRKLRDRRIAAGVVAMLVAIGGSYAAFTAFRSSSGSTVAVGSLPPPIPATAQMTCDGHTTEVSTPAVQPQPDGVHIAVENTSGQDLGLEVQDVGDENAPLGTHDTIWQIGPGNYEVRCTSPLPNADAGPFQPLVVQDPDHLWISTDLDCDSVTGTASAVVPGAVGGKGTPAGILESHLTGVQSDDTIAAAGYSNGSEPMIRIVRDGKVIALYHFMSDEQGGWLVDSSQQCSSANLGWSESPSVPYPRGAFAWCPASPFPEAGRDRKHAASEAALKFVDAFRASDMAALANLMDDSVPMDAIWPITVAPGTTPTIIETSAAGGDLVRFGCGSDVDAHTVSVAIEDGTDSASLDFTLYLVYRNDGWKVWGAY